MAKFDAAAATAQYMATLSPAAHAKATAYTQGGEWILLWGALISIAMRNLVANSASRFGGVWRTALPKLSDGGCAISGACSWVRAKQAPAMTMAESFFMGSVAARRGGSCVPARGGDPLCRKTRVAGDPV